MFKEQLNKIKKHPPRDVSRVKALSYSSAHWWSVLLGLFLLNGIIVLLAIGLQSMENDKRLIEHGIITMAQVSKVELLLSRWDCAEIYYQFAALSKKLYRGKTKGVDRYTECNLKRGDWIQIRYLPDHPEVNDIVRGAHKPARISVVLHVLIFIVNFLSLPLLAQAFSLRRDRKLFRNGIWVNGKVVTVNKDGIGLQNRLATLLPLKMIVSFKTQDGKTVETQIKSRHRWLFGKLKPGADINIFYDAANPSRAFMLESFLL